VVVSDIAVDPLWADYRHLPLAHGLRACWSVPIISSEGQVLGTFAMYYREPHSPSPHELHVLEQIASLGAMSITHQRAAEKVRQDERELRQLIDFLPQHVLVLDKDGKLLQANKTMLDYNGYTLEEMQGAGTQERIKRDLHPDDLERANSERSAGLSRGVPFEIEKRMLGKDGRYRWFLFRYKPVLNEDGHIVRWFATATDIEDRKHAEDRMRNETVALREDIVRSSMFEEIVGSSEALRNILGQVSMVAPTDSTVLILGETGTGKELIARAIHKQSNRSARAFIRVNCAAIPAALIASELFGHEKGSFTGAIQQRMGRFEAADGGTIFLDEVGDLPAETQIALLRVLQEREFERVGSVKPIRIDVRVIAATNRELDEAVADRTFRQDLFYRLNIFPIRIPSLRERADDIPLLVDYFVERYAKKAGKKIRSISKKTLDLLQSYNWPGNIRELQNVVERAVILCGGETFSVDETWLKRESRQPYGPTVALARTLEEQEREAIETALSEAHGQVGGPKGAAAKLGVPRQTLESKIKMLAINKFRFKTP
jgi:formate hydrogenlyase transcriptional activator